METIRNKVQSKGPGKRRGSIVSDFINKWGILSMDMDCFPKEKFFVYISTGLSSNADSLFVRRPKGVCVIQLFFLHAFVYKWFQAVDPYTKFNNATVLSI